MNIKIKMRTKIKFKKVELSVTCILFFFVYLICGDIYLLPPLSVPFSFNFIFPPFIRCSYSLSQFFLLFSFFSFLFFSYLIFWHLSQLTSCIAFFLFLIIYPSSSSSSHTSYLPSFLPSFLGLLASFLPSFLCYNLFLILFFIFALIIILLFFLLFQDLQVLLGIHTVAAILTETQENIENRNGLQKRISRKRNKDITMNTYDKIKGEKKSNDQW